MAYTIEHRDRDALVVDQNLSIYNNVPNITNEK